MDIYKIVLVAFSAILLAANISCEKETYKTLPPIVDTTITDTSIYIDVTLNGTRILGIQNLNGASSGWGQYWPGAPGVTGDNHVYPFNKGLGAGFMGEQNQYFFFTKVSRDTIPGIYSDQHIWTLPPATFLDTFFLPGNYNYSMISGDTIVVNTYSKIPDTVWLLDPGITIAWIDSTGKVWASFLGSANQSGSHFIIDSFHVASSPTFANVATVTAHFDCMLYDSLGNTLHLTKGRFRQPIYP